MRKKFATNLVFLLAANFIVKPFWIFGIDRVVQNRVGPEEYGLYFAVFNYSFLFSIVLDFGLNNFNNRAVSRNPSRLSGYFANLFLLKFFLSIAYTVLTFLFASASGYTDVQLKLLLSLILNQILLSAILFFRSNLAALQFFKTDAIVSVLDRLLTIAFCGWLLWFSSNKSDFRIEWFIHAQTFALLITAFVAGLLVWSKNHVRLEIWKPKFSRNILWSSAPFALLALLMGIYSRIDAIMIERLLPNGKEEAGIYAASFRLLDAANQFGYLFSVLLLPLFAALIRQKSPVNQLVKFSAELIFAGSVALSMSCAFFGNEIMQLLYPRANENWYRIFPLIMLTFIPMSSVYVFGTALTAKGSMKHLNIIALCGVLLNVVLNLTAIPKYGAYGAAWATLITQSIVAFLHLLVAVRLLHLRYSGQLITRIAIFILLCPGAALLTTNIPAPWIINFGLSVLVCVVFAIAMNLLPLKETFRFFRGGNSTIAPR